MNRFTHKRLALNNYIQCKRDWREKRSPAAAYALLAGWMGLWRHKYATPTVGRVSLEYVMNYEHNLLEFAAQCCRPELCLSNFQYMVQPLSHWPISPSAADNFMLLDEMELAIAGIQHIRCCKGDWRDAGAELDVHAKVISECRRLLGANLDLFRSSVEDANEQLVHFRPNLPVEVKSTISKFKDLVKHFEH